MSEKAWGISKTILSKAGEIALLFVKTGAEWGTKLAAKGAGIAAKTAELTARGLQAESIRKLRPAMRMIMCVSTAVAIISGILYFAGRKEKS